MLAPLKKAALLRGLLDGEVAYTGPFYVNLYLTRRCNLRCVGCRYHGPSAKRPSSGDHAPTDMPYDLAMDVIDQLESAGTCIVTLVGEGENFLYRHLFDVIDRAKAAEFHVTVLTNGTLLDDDTIRSVLESRLDILRVSLWAASPEEFASSYPGSDPDNLRQVADGLRRLSRRKQELHTRAPRVLLHRPIHRDNQRGIDSLLELAYDTGCDGVTFGPLRVVREDLEALALTPEEEHAVRQSLVGAGRKLASRSLSHNVQEALCRYGFGRPGMVQPCYIGWTHAAVGIDGALFPCKQIPFPPVGDLRTQPFHEIWNGPAYRRFRRRTLSHQGMPFSDTDCSFCCHALPNLRVHRWFKWFAPFSRQRV